MSEAFEVLSAALKEAIEDIKSDTPILKREILSFEEQPNTNDERHTISTSFRNLKEREAL